MTRPLATAEDTTGDPIAVVPSSSVKVTVPPFTVPAGLVTPANKVKT